SELLPQRRHVVVAGVLRDVNGRQVSRVRERVPQRDRPVVLVLVVLGRPDLIVELERLRFVVDNRRGCHVGLALGEGLLEGRQIHERLEDRSRLAPRQYGTVVLRLVIGTAADKGEQLAGARIDGDERGLGLPAAAAPRQQLVDACQPAANGVLRDALQVEGERLIVIDRFYACSGESRIVLCESLVYECYDLCSLLFSRKMRGLLM